MSEHLKEIRFAEVLQLMPGCSFDELCKIERLVRIRQLIVIQVPRFVFEKTFQFGFHPEAIFIAGVLRIGHETHQRYSLIHAFFGRFKTPNVKEHHFTQHVPEMTARKRIITDESDTVKPKESATEGKDVLLDFGRHP
jgi:hypothetical protein